MGVSFRLEIDSPTDAYLKKNLLIFKNAVDDVFYMRNIDIAKKAVSERDPLIFDESSDVSLINIVPPYMKAAIEAVPKEYFVLSEAQLRRTLKPSFEVSQIRINFWTEYQNAQFNKKYMNMANVYRDVYSAETFINWFVLDVKKMAWILKPPASWESGMRAVLNKGMEVMYDAVHSANVVSEDGFVDSKNLNAVMRVVERAIAIVHGLPTIRTESKSVHVNVNQDMSAGGASRTVKGDVKDLEALKLEIDKLRKYLDAPTLGSAAVAALPDSVDSVESAPPVVTVSSPGGGDD